MFIGALFGDMQYSFTPDGDDGIFHAGRNGRLHVTEPDGSTHGNHSYLSAVAVLRFCYSQDIWAAAMLQSQDTGYIEPLALLREANRLVAQQSEITARGTCLDVYETVSRSAIPLRRDIFIGPDDTRWGIIGGDRYGQIGGAPN